MLKNTKGYLHYQTAKCALNPLGMSDAYYIRIKDDKEGVYYDKQTCGVNGYVELNPELTYYIQIAILKRPLENAIFMLSLVDYGPNYNLKEEAIELIALSPQHFTIFKNISNLSINESFAFNIELNSGFAADTYLLIKNYESCDFEKIYKSCPSKIEMFDYQIDTPYGTRKYEITKKNNFTNGILLGVFFVQNYVQMGTTTIKIYESNNNENDSDSDKGDSDEMITGFDVKLTADDYAVKEASLETGPFETVVKGKESYPKIRSSIIEPGEKAKGYAGFTVPKDKKKLKLKIDLSTSDDIVIDIDNPVYEGE